jgi:hypothetical protein
VVQKEILYVTEITGHIRSSEIPMTVFEITIAQLRHYKQDYASAIKKRKTFSDVKTYLLYVVSVDVILQ